MLQRKAVQNAGTAQSLPQPRYVKEQTAEICHIQVRVVDIS